VTVVASYVVVAAVFLLIGATLGYWTACEDAAA
jgi:hypothetical protein